MIRTILLVLGVAIAARVGWGIGGSIIDSYRGSMTCKIIEGK